MVDSDAENREWKLDEGLAKEPLFALHAELSRRLKEYDQVLDDIPVDVLNEFRYAGRSTLQLVAILRKHTDMEALRRSPDFATYENQYEHAEHAFRCGYHDLIDGLVYELTKFLDEMSANLSTEAITAMGEYRNEILNDIEECNRVIAESRGELDQRDGLYEEIYRGWFARLLQHKKILTQSVLPKILEVEKRVEDERDALLQLRIDEERKALKRHNSNTRLALVGIAVTIALSLFQIAMAL